MDDMYEALGLVQLYEKCIGHGASLQAIKEAAWNRLLEINASLMAPSAAPVEPAPQMQLRAEPEEEGIEAQEGTEETDADPQNPTVLERRL